MLFIDRCLARWVKPGLINAIGNYSLTAVFGIVGACRARYFNARTSACVRSGADFQ